MNEIKSLEKTEIQVLHRGFQRAFENYFVPMEMSDEQFKDRMSSENVDFSLSFGHFEEGRLSGFMLHAAKEENGRKKAYNAGTGVIPSARGKGVSQQLYKAALRKLLEQGVQEVQLEVITTNESAIRVYEKSGFKIVRELIYLKQELNEKDAQPAAQKTVDLRKIEKPDWTLLHSFRDWNPAWQNSDFVLDGMGEKILKTGAFTKNKLAGYIMFNPASGKIHQLAVHPDLRRQGVGTALLNHAIKNREKPLVVPNMDASDIAYLSFLNAFGFKEQLRQFEMKKIL